MRIVGMKRKILTSFDKTKGINHFAKLLSIFRPLINRRNVVHSVVKGEIHFKINDHSRRVLARTAHSTVV